MAVWPAKCELLLALAQDLVQHGGGNACAAEPADGEVIAVVDEAADGLGDRHDLVGQGSRFVGEELAGAIRGGIAQQGAVTLGEDVHAFVVRVRSQRSP